jgi:hypothetical protein
MKHLNNLDLNGDDSLADLVVTAPDGGVLVLSEQGASTVGSAAGNVHPGYGTAESVCQSGRAHG